MRQQTPLRRLLLQHVHPSMTALHHPSLRLAYGSTPCAVNLKIHHSSRYTKFSFGAIFGGSESLNIRLAPSKNKWFFPPNFRFSKTEWTLWSKKICTKTKFVCKKFWKKFEHIHSVLKWESNALWSFAGVRCKNKWIWSAQVQRTINGKFGGIWYCWDSMGAVHCAKNIQLCRHAEQRLLYTSLTWSLHAWMNSVLSLLCWKVKTRMFFTPRTAVWCCSCERMQLKNMDRVISSYRVLSKTPFVPHVGKGNEQKLQWIRA